jgi:YidC/Oxa1 family membrane protein insertase
MKDEQKRIFLAMGLSLLVMLAWLRFFGPKPETVPPPAPDEAAELGPSSSPDDVARKEGQETAAPVAPPVAVAPAPEPEARERLFKGSAEGGGAPWAALFTSRGGGIRRLELYRYPEAYVREDTVLLEAEDFPLGAVELLPSGSDGQKEGEMLTAAWEEVEEEGQTVSYRLKSSTGLELVKRFYPLPTPYGLGLEIRLVNRGEAIQSTGLRLWGPLGFRKESQGRDPSQAVFLGRIRDRPHVDRKPLSSLGKKPIRQSEIRTDWAALQGRYFGVAISPAPEKGGGGGWRVAGARPLREREREAPSEEDTGIYLEAEEVSLGPGEEKIYRLQLFAGPLTESALAPYGRLQELPDRGVIKRSILGIMNFFYRMTGNYGIAVVLLTLVIRLFLSPLTWKNQVHMLEAQKKMQKLKPKMDEIQKRFANNPKKRNQEMMQLMRESGNPYGAMAKGCLPMLLQLPIIIALWRTLDTAVELYRAPFGLWIKDLSQPDRLPLSFSLPLLGEHLNLLPLLMAVSFILQAKLTPQPPNPDPQAQQQQKMMQMMMPIMMLFFFYGLASGLVLYLLASTTFGILESRYIRSRFQAAA